MISSILYSPLSKSLPSLIIPFSSKKPEHLPCPCRSPWRRSTTTARARSGGGGKGSQDGGATAEDVQKGEDDRLRGFRWRDLLEPDPENIAAVGLTGLLAWASAQALAQIFFISLAIVLAALKYSFIAAILLAIVIALL